MTNLIERLTEAIFRQEGMSDVYDNPGNLRDAPWLPVIQRKYREMPGSGRFWDPQTRAQGVAGAVHVVALYIARGVSLAELLSAWAPLSDGNNTSVYIKNVKTWASIPDEHRPLWEYLEEKDGGQKNNVA